MHPAEEAADRFLTYIQTREPLARRANHDAQLDHCFVDWVRFGDGAEATRGDFLIFTLAMLVVADRLRKDPSLLDYQYTISRGRKRSIERRLGTLLGYYDASYTLSGLHELFDAYVARSRTSRS
jgi:hypothetical protein